MSHHSTALPDPWFLITLAGGPATMRSLTNSVLERLALDVWLIPPSLRYAARNFSIENTVSRDSM